MTHTLEMASLWRSWRELRIPVRTVAMIPSWTNISILTVLKRRHTTITTIPTPRAVRVSTNCSLLILFPLPRMSLLESKRLAFPRTIKGMLFLFSSISSPLISPNLSKVTLLNQTYSNQPSTKYRPSFSLSISFVVVPWTSPLSQRELLTLLESYPTPLPSLSMNPRKAMQWSLQSLLSRRPSSHERVLPTLLHFNNNSHRFSPPYNQRIQDYKRRSCPLNSFPLPPLPLLKLRLEAFLLLSIPLLLNFRVHRLQSMSPVWWTIPYWTQYYVPRPTSRIVLWRKHPSLWHPRRKRAKTLRWFFNISAWLLSLLRTLVTCLKA